MKIERTLDQEGFWGSGSYKENRVPKSPRRIRSVSAECCGQQAIGAVLELNRELVAQNVWLREKLTAGAMLSGEELRRENERLRQQVAELEKQLEEQKEIALLSAKVIASRITCREGKQFVEYQLQIETDTRGTLYAWHRFSTFRKLAESLQSNPDYWKKDIPELPSKHVFGNFSEKLIQERMVKLNHFLEAATNAEYLEWGIWIDSATSVYKRRMKTSTLKSSLRSKLWEFQFKENTMQGRANVVSAKVVDSRIQAQVEEPFIEYQLQIETECHNSLLVWHEYRYLYHWAGTLQTESNYHCVPHLPKEEPFGSFSKHIPNQVAKLNAFFKKVIKSDDLRWCVRIDDKLCVFTLKVAAVVPPSRTARESAKTQIDSSTLFPETRQLQRRAQAYERKMAQAG
ncbi:hypothetical protein PHYBOEH_002778 [Phytophthora boehmeriae]|uniref:PX domain-containing protein n=1 Tax=Phytophthora boehmeriae TaxID=109152 RepID=A0A8T1WWA4_9STRA|nr:hypothetical protein PHYBOEH_002778 [Phytophthora boehmeriae]